MRNHGPRRGVRRPTPDPESLKDLVPAVLRGMRRNTGGAVGRIRQAWLQVVGEEVARRTRVIGFSDGCIRVLVASAALKHDLAVFRRASVLEGLKRELPGLSIRTVSFRVGAVS